MPTYNMVVLSIILLAVCMAQDLHIHARPARPEKFENQAQVEAYVRQLKEFLDRSTPRYGKRFSPPVYRKYATEMAPENFQRFYQMYKNLNSVI